MTSTGIMIIYNAIVFCLGVFLIGLALFDKGGRAIWNVLLLASGLGLIASAISQLLFG